MPHLLLLPSPPRPRRGPCSLEAPVSSVCRVCPGHKDGRNKNPDLKDLGGTQRSRHRTRDSAGRAEESLIKCVVHLGNWPRPGAVKGRRESSGRLPRAVGRKNTPGRPGTDRVGAEGPPSSARQAQPSSGRCSERALWQPRRRVMGGHKEAQTR